ncbi:MAG: glycosyltransferase [Planctomycetaceae bacterium]|nr:glycosyltransferase [Planctomycetaceae bacterium]
MTLIETNENKPKIAHFIWWIPHYRVTIFRRLCQHEGMNFTIYAGDNTQVVGGNSVASANEVGEMEGIKWKHLKSVRIKHWPFKDYEWQPDAIKLVLKEDFDAVIFLGGHSLSNILAKIICRFRGIKVVDWGMGVRGPENKIKWLFRMVQGKLAQARLIYGKFASDWYVQNGFKKETVFTVRNSLNYEEHLNIRKHISKECIQKIREDFGLMTDQSKLIFYSGRLQKNKELNILIDSIKIFAQKGLNVKAILIGDGLEEFKLKEYAKKVGVFDKIIFYGANYDEEVIGELIMASDLCVVPGAIGLTAIHSMVFGVPVLTHENKFYIHGPEVEAVIEGKTGGFFRRNDPIDLAEKAEKLLYPRPAKETMSAECMKMVDDCFNPFYQEKIIIKCLNSVLPINKQISEK